MKVIGREYEIGRLKESLKSDKSELIAVYGRRRVGKTFLIRNTLKDHIKFEVTGLYGGSIKQQLDIFFDELKNSPKQFCEKDKPENWKEAFRLLKAYIDGLKSKAKKVIFIDEMPWLDTHKSQFRMYFSHFWNTYCEKREDLIVVLCGSAASYIIDNVISDQGSLHARITFALQIRPFSLHEVEEYLSSKNIKGGYYDRILIYIAIGGIPHYLNKLRKSESVNQAIQRLCFDSNGDLINEIDEIFKSLFKNSTAHISIVRELGKSNKGVTRDVLIKRTKLSGGGHFSTVLDELIYSGFVTRYNAHGNKTKLALYRLSDEYSRFYLKFIEPNKNQGPQFWKTMSSKQSYTIWAGFNFETICLKHIQQIKHALGVSGIHSTNSSWSGSDAQIDLVIERDDNRTNLFEMKFYSHKFTIDKGQVKNLRNKMSAFKNDTGIKDGVVLSMLTTYGVTENQYYHELVEDDLQMEILFQKASK